MSHISRWLLLVSVILQISNLETILHSGLFFLYTLYIADCQLIQTKMFYTYLTYTIPDSLCHQELLSLPCKALYMAMVQQPYISKNSYGKRNPAVVGSQLNQSFLMNLTTLPRCKTPVFVVIVVFSSPKNIEERSVICSTWAEIKDTDSSITNIANEGSYSNPKRLVKTIFLLGKPDKKRRKVE